MVKIGAVCYITPMPGPMPTLVNYFPPLDPYLNVLHQDDDILVLDKQSGLCSACRARIPAMDCSILAQADMAFRRPACAIVSIRYWRTGDGAQQAPDGRIGSQFGTPPDHKILHACASPVTTRLIAVLVDLPLAADRDNKLPKVSTETGKFFADRGPFPEREPVPPGVRLILTGRTPPAQISLRRPSAM
ncbi:MAG: hypothetical protein MO852_07920 [Candidatus Devosia euplotis]|nr:hypothetical protein [Candidatus Devosia euplotis]